MTVTINTDASYCQIQKVAGFACYIKCNLGLIKKTGKINAPESASDCDLKAIANALYLLEKSKFNKGQITFIVINTDCKSLFKQISKRSKYDAGRYAANMISRIQKKSKWQGMCSIRHVKAHSGINDTRSWVNEWCNKNAKMEMRKQRHYLTQVQKG